MSYSERIQSMLDSGLISDAQAQSLENSLKPLRQEIFSPVRRKIPVLKTLSILALLALLGFIFSPGDADTVANAIQNVDETLNKVEGVAAMNNGVSTFVSTFILLLPIILIVLLFAFLHNGIVSKEEAVMGAWAQVESNYQRRADLIPNLVETVSAYVKHERETLEAVTDERADALNPLADAVDGIISQQEKAGQMMGGKIKLENETAVSDLDAAQKALGQSLNKLMLVAENYPNLKAGDNFLALQAQLEGTENRINVARMEFNEAVRSYNAAIRRLPGSLVAGIGNFQRKAYFESTEGAAKPVSVKFDE